MNGKAFFDTNILVYAASPGDARFANAAKLVAGGGIISVQVLNEFANVARRKLRYNWNEIFEQIDDFAVVFPNPRPITVAIHMAALAIAERDGLAIYDSLLIASALEAGCRLFFSEDMQNGRVIDGKLTIRNPFTAH